MSVIVLRCAALIRYKIEDMHSSAIVLRYAALIRSKIEDTHLSAAVLRCVFMHAAEAC